MLRFREKDGKEREIPVRHDLSDWLNDHIKAAGIEADSKTRAPLFRSADGKRQGAGLFSLQPESHAPDDGTTAGRRRALGFIFPAQLPRDVVTDLLNQNIPLEDVQYLAGHSSPTTIRIYESAAAEGDAEYCGADFDLGGSLSKCSLATNLAANHDIRLQQSGRSIPAGGTQGCFGCRVTEAGLAPCQVFGAPAFIPEPFRPVDFPYL
jgi:hypothetical protein